MLSRAGRRGRGVAAGPGTGPRLVGLAAGGLGGSGPTCCVLHGISPGVCCEYIRANLVCGGGAGNSAPTPHHQGVPHPSPCTYIHSNFKNRGPPTHATTNPRQRFFGLSLKPAPRRADTVSMNFTTEYLRACLTLADELARLGFTSEASAIAPESLISELVRRESR